MAPKFQPGINGYEVQLKISEVKKLSPIDRFLYWIRERHNIYLRRRAGASKPWTDDEVLQSYFFTHPYRELDKVTRWFKENIREPLRNRPEVLFATVCFRWFNLPEPTGRILMVPESYTRFKSHPSHRIVPVPGQEGLGWCDRCRAAEIELEQVECLTAVKEGLSTAKLLRSLLCNWNPDRALSVLYSVREHGGQIFTGAFMINSPPGEPKLEAIVRRVNNVWEAREHLLAHWDKEVSMEGFHSALTTFDGMGGFMAYEVVCDLRYTYLLENAPDKLTWCNPGPGCIRGLYRILEMPFEKGNNSSSPPKPKDFMSHMTMLLSLVQKRLRHMPPFEMREIEHSLCELDKYSRALEGDGKLKRKYNGK